MVRHVSTAPAERTLRWLGRQVVRDPARRLALEVRLQDWLVQWHRSLLQWRLSLQRWRSGPAAQQALDRTLEDLWRRLHPRTLKQGALARVGGDGDGGYVMAQVTGPGTVVSIGVGADNTADLWFAEQGWRVVEWDPTISAPPVAHAGISFHPVGLGPEGASQRLTLPAIVAASSLAGPAILMVDIEGDEYLARCGWEAESLAPFDQVVIELHDLHAIVDPAQAVRLEALLDALLAAHTVVHVHANNCSPMIQVHGLPLPDALEVTLVAQRLASDILVEDDLPSPLDRPNEPNLRDHVLHLSRIAARCRRST